MDLLILSGNSLQNRDYAYAAQNKLQDLFAHTYIQGYKHWQTGADWIDLPHELEILKVFSPNASYGIFAKSIGTVLAVQAIASGIIKPKFLLLLGIPMDYIVRDYPEFGQTLANANLPTIIIQNDHDPVGTAQDVLNYLPQSQKHSLITSKGNTHDYEDYTLLRQQLASLQKGV